MYTVNKMRVNRGGRYKWHYDYGKYGNSHRDQNQPRPDVAVAPNPPKQLLRQSMRSVNRNH